MNIGAKIVFKINSDMRIYPNLIDSATKILVVKKKNNFQNSISR